MQLGSRNHTVGDIRKYTVCYAKFLATGAKVASVVVTSTSATATVSGATVAINEKSITFLIHGGTLNELFTITVQATLNTTEVLNDTIAFNTVAP